MMDAVFQEIAMQCRNLLLRVDETTAGIDNHRLILYTGLGTAIWIYVYQKVFDRVSPIPLKLRIKNELFRRIRQLPIVGSKIQAEIDKAEDDVRGLELFKLVKTSSHGVASSYQTKLPKNGRSESDVLADLNILRGEYDHDISLRQFTGSVYSGEEELANMWSKVYRDYCWSNPLHTEMFKSVRKMEAEILSQTLSLYDADDDCCGTMTSGGTESIFQAVLAYRNRYRDTYGYGCHTGCPELVLPQTAHPAFNKACHYLGVKVVKVTVDPVTKKVQPASVKAAISSRTMAVVVSAPQYPDGVFDPLAKVGALAKNAGIPCHVDSCLGSYLVPFAHEAGFKDVPLLNFNVPGITSISCDIHKFGCTPKGTSVVLFKTKELRAFSFYAFSDWPGGLYSTVGPPGSRPGANVAMAWATMQKIGHSGYVDRCRKILTLAKRLEKIAQKAPGLTVIPVELQTISFTSKSFNIYNMLDAMAKRHWDLQALQFPASIHIGLTYAHVLSGEDFVARFEKDVIEVCTELNKPGAKLADEGSAALYGSTATIPDRSIVEDTMKVYWAQYYETK